jgi:acetyl esterase/lipase
MSPIIPDTIQGVPGWWCIPADAEAGRAILYLHGGWFVMGSAGAYRNFVGHIAARTHAAAFIPDYRLAPEHPLPAATDDARFVYDGLSKPVGAALVLPAARWRSSCWRPSYCGAQQSFRPAHRVNGDT